MPKVSVIIPVYNAENFLKRCLDSVCNQTLSDIEIICINDCSTDKSVEILKQYNVKIINLEENKGAAYARNIGIEQACGEYLGFVDSDDYIAPDFYEKLYSKSGADIIKGSYKYYDSGYINEDLNKKIKIYKNNFSYEFCSAIYKTSLIKENKIIFPNLRDMEDPVFALFCAKNAKNIETVDDAYINICAHSDSQTAQKPSFNRICDKLKGLSQIINLVNSFNTQNNGGNFVCALWFFITAGVIEKVDFNTKLYLSKELLSLYENIRDKESFFYHLRELSPLLYKCFKEKNQENLVFYVKNKTIEDNLIKIKELELSNKKLSEYNDFLIRNYVKESLNTSDGEDIYFISVVNNYDLYHKCLGLNPFVTEPRNNHLVDFDNTKENIFIPHRYNSFLEKYDYSKDSWFVFCHCDWEPMEDIRQKLKTLDKNYIYGPVGSKAEMYKNKLMVYITGFCYEKRRDGSGLRPLGALEKGIEPSDTFDCQALFVHSSLIKKYNLRFDENLKWDLYVEDFCINAKKQHAIESYAFRLEACHWSGYHKTPASYYQSLDYINAKYPNDYFGGTVSHIGGAKIELANQKECLIFKLARNIKGGINA